MRFSYMYDSTLLDIWRLLLAAFSATVENQYTSRLRFNKPASSNTVFNCGRSAKFTTGILVRKVFNLQNFGFASSHNNSRYFRSCFRRVEMTRLWPQKRLNEILEKLEVLYGNANQVVVRKTSTSELISILKETNALAVELSVLNCNSRTKQNQKIFC